MLQIARGRIGEHTHLRCACAASGDLLLLSKAPSQWVTYGVTIFRGLRHVTLFSWARSRHRAALLPHNSLLKQ